MATMHFTCQHAQTDSLLRLCLISYRSCAGGRRLPKEGKDSWVGLGEFSCKGDALQQSASRQHH